MKTENPDEWDENEDVGKRGPEPKRLNTSKTPEEAARRIMKAGKPKPGELDEEEEWEEDEII